MITLQIIVAGAMSIRARRTEPPINLGSPGTHTGQEGLFLGSLPALRGGRIGRTSNPCPFPHAPTSPTGPKLGKEQIVHYCLKRLP